jgi:hypothetical protein
MQKYLEKTGEIRFEKIFSQRLGFLLLKDFAENVAETSCPQIKFYEAIKEYEKLETPEERLTKAREVYDHHIMVCNCRTLALTFAPEFPETFPGGNAGSLPCESLSLSPAR